MLSQTCINFFLVLNTKGILKNVGNQTVAGPHWLWKKEINNMEVTDDQQLSGFPHSSK